MRKRGSSFRSSLIQAWPGHSKDTMAAKRKDTSKKVSAPQGDPEVLALLLLKDRLAKRGLWRSVHAVDRALNTLGYEIAGVEEDWYREF